MPDLNGSFVPTTNVWDTSEVLAADVNSEEFKQLLVRLYQNINTIAIVLNSKDTGYYVSSKFTNGQLFFPNPALTSQSSSTPIYRNVIRYVVNFGALPNTGSKSVAHTLTPNSS